jgi:hypothetical protein
MSARALGLRIQPGERWQVALPGVYATFTGPMSPRHQRRAALLYAGPGAVLGGATACTVEGLRYVPPGPIDVLLPATGRRGAAPAVRLRRTHREIRHVVRDGLHVVALDRALVDACRPMVALRPVRALLGEAVQRRLITIEALEAELEAGEAAGRHLPRLAVQGLRAGVRSAPEGELRDLLSSSRVLPPATYNGPPIRGDDGRVIAVPDASLEAARLLVECDSVEHHGLDVADFQATMRRHSLLESRGYCVLHVTPAQLRADPAGTLAMVERTYLMRVALLRPDLLSPDLLSPDLLSPDQKAPARLPDSWAS